jgi:hypothetical protein
MAVEKEIEKTESAPQPNAVFDDSSNFLIYATLLGIKVSFFALNWVAIISLPSVICIFSTVNFFSLLANAMQPLDETLFPNVFTSYAWS